MLEEGLSATAATSLAILGYAAHKAAATVAALYGGRLIDRASPHLAFAAGAACYVAAYSIFAAGAGGWRAVLVAFPTSVLRSSPGSSGRSCHRRRPSRT